MNIAGSPLVPSRSEPAIIMAGGYGLRLGELTRDRPKPLVPLAGRPILDHVASHLTRHGFRRIAVTLHHLGFQIQDYLEREGPRLAGAGSLEIRFSHTAQNHGAAGGVLRASRLIEGDPLLIASGDVITNLDLDRLMRVHRERGAAMTILAVKAPNPSEFGVLHLCGDDRVRRLREKPNLAEIQPAWINAGIYVVSRRVIERIPARRPFDFSLDLIPLLLSEGEPVFADPQEGVWFDIGTPESLREAEQFFANHGIEGARLQDWSLGTLNARA